VSRFSDVTHVAIDAALHAQAPRCRGYVWVDVESKDAGWLHFIQQVPDPVDPLRHGM
jgi:hypothetical protein